MSLEDARVWRTALPAYQPRSEEYQHASKPRFVQDHEAWPVPAQAPRALMQVPLRPTLNFLLVHSKRLGRRSVLCLFGSGRWNPEFTDSSGTKPLAVRFQFWRCPHEQGKAYR
jgi:hypothetical protein